MVKKEHAVLRPWIQPTSKAQVWIETVIYTLIAFLILGAVLGFARPKIEQIQDKAVIGQSVEMLESIDSVIGEIQAVSGNKRQMEFSVKKGAFTIDGENDRIFFEIKSEHDYSEPGKMIQRGDVEILTEETGGINNIKATLNYAGKYNLTADNSEKQELLAKSPAPYKIFISNEGSENSLTKINFEIS